MRCGKLASRLVVLLVAGAISLALGELVARWILPPPQRVVIAEASTRSGHGPTRPRESYHLWLARHPEEGGIYVETATGRRLRPNTVALIDNHALSHRRIEIRTNSLGFRNPEIGAKQRTRILFLGDSITFGDYLDESETFVRLIEEENRDWETINAGVGAIGLETELAILVESGLALDPDVVVVGFYLNDFQDSAGVHVPRLPRWLERSWVAQHTARIATLWRLQPAAADLPEWRREFSREFPVGRGDYRRDPAAFNAIILESLADWGGAWSPHAWERMEPVLSEFARLSAIHAFRLVLVAFPVRHQVEAEFVYAEPQQRLEAVARRLAVPLLDLLPVLRAEYRRSADTLFYDQCHHTPRASRLIAREIAGFLRARLEPGEGSPARAG